MCTAKRLLGLGAPECPVVHRTVSGAPGWRLSKDYSRVSTAAYGYTSPDCPVVHRTVFGELAAVKSPLSGTKSTAYDYNSPDCPVSQRSAGPTVGRVICA
jgi:hypothetical protein